MQANRPLQWKALNRGLVLLLNEFGEGGIVAPTEGEKEMKLEAVREVFGR